MRADTFDRFRSSLDADVTVIPQKFGLRFDAVHDDRGSNLKPSKNIRDSAYIAARLRPDPATTIDVNAEASQFRQQIPRSVVVFDWYNTWAAAGSPLVPIAGSTAALNGVEFQVTNGYPVFIAGVGAYDWSRSGLGARPLINGTRDAQVSFGKSSPLRPISVDTYTAGDGDHVYLNTQNVSALVQRRLAPGLNLEIGGRFENSLRENGESQGTGADNTVKVDANRQTPAASPTPMLACRTSSRPPTTRKSRRPRRNRARRSPTKRICRASNCSITASANLRSPAFTPTTRSTATTTTSAR